VKDRALVFGSVADAYERHRLGYPDTVADLMLAYARLPVTVALEVGAGTGKATRLFAGRGLEVTACEPDVEMAAVLRRTTDGLPVTVVVAPFEALGHRTGRTFDALYCAQAWHWTDPGTRGDLTASLVRPGGTICLFGMVDAGSRLVDRALDEQVRALESAVLPHVAQATDARSSTGTWWPGSDLETDARFADVEEHDVARVVVRRRADHLALLATLSPYLRLSRDGRAALLGSVAAVLPDELEVDATVRLHLARRV